MYGRPLIIKYIHEDDLNNSEKDVKPVEMGPSGSGTQSHNVDSNYRFLHA